MYTLSILLSLLSLTLAGVDALAIDPRAAACNAADVAWVKRRISHPTYFCTWYLSDGRTRSPLTTLSVAELQSACGCITAESAAQTLTTVKTAPSSPVCDASDVAVVTDEYRNPDGFCNFWIYYPRTTSPIRGKSVEQISRGCECYSASSRSGTTSSEAPTSTTTTRVTLTTTRAASTVTSTRVPSTAVATSTAAASTEACNPTPLPASPGSFASGLTSWTTTTSGPASVSTSPGSGSGSSPATALLSCTYAADTDSRAAMISPHLDVCPGAVYAVAFRYRFPAPGGRLNLYDYGYSDLLASISGPEAEGGSDGEGTSQGSWGRWAGNVTAKGSLDVLLFGLECLDGQGSEGAQATVAVDDVSYVRL